MLDCIKDLSRGKHQPDGPHIYAEHYLATSTSIPSAPKIMRESDTHLFSTTISHE
jgi:hypothetical protein